MGNDDYFKGIYRIFSISELGVEKNHEVATVMDTPKLRGTKMIFIILINLFSGSVIF